VQSTQYMLGGAANVAKCLIALGAAVRLCGVIGDDDDGNLLVRETENLGIESTHLVRDKQRPTTRKTRVVARQQQVIRLDHETTGRPSEDVARRLVKQVKQACEWADAIVISDYAKGVLTDAVCKATIKAAGGKPVIVDPKDPPWDRFAGATVIKPNVPETAALTGQRAETDEDARKIAGELTRRFNTQGILLTRGSRGMTLVEVPATNTRNSKARSKHYHFTARQRDVFDVTGAGDVVAAVAALAMAAGAALPEAAWLANVAAGVKIAKFGAAAVNGQEILEAIDAPNVDRTAGKVMSAAYAAQLAAELRRQGKSVVFTNGCFDILHLGHVQYLQQSR
ncbi:MAG: PfkB family carbohydrate kinase, partial [Firmicutes bacterium]|nr:PfkB family carbohydrate kinase [Bacillota bacterium]